MGIFDELFGGNFLGGWDQVNENTSTSDTLGIRVPSLDTRTGSGWDNPGDTSGGFGWGNVKSDF